jgi:hypothetical protein
LVWRRQWIRHVRHDGWSLVVVLGWMRDALQYWVDGARKLRRRSERVPRAINKQYTNSGDCALISRKGLANRAVAYTALAALFDVNHQFCHNQRLSVGCGKDCRSYMAIWMATRSVGRAIGRDRRPPAFWLLMGEVVVLPNPLLPVNPIWAREKPKPGSPLSGTSSSYTYRTHAQALFYHILAPCILIILLQAPFLASKVAASPGSRRLAGGAR